MNHADAEATESYIRVNITENSKGFNREVSVHFRWVGAKPADEVQAELQNLIATGDSAAMAEIDRMRGSRES